MTIVCNSSAEVLCSVSTVVYTADTIFPQNSVIFTRHNHAMHTHTCEYTCIHIIIMTSTCTWTIDILGYLEQRFGPKIALYTLQFPVLADLKISDKVLRLEGIAIIIFCSVLFGTRVVF